MGAEGNDSRRSPKPCTAVRRVRPGEPRYHTSLRANTAAWGDTAPTLPVVGTTFVMVNVAGLVPCKRYGRAPLSSTSSLTEGTNATRSEPSLGLTSTAPALVADV